MMFEPVYDTLNCLIWNLYIADNKLREYKILSYTIILLISNHPELLT